MGLRKVIAATFFMAFVEWTIYLTFQGRYGIDVQPAMYGVTVPFMIFANFISAIVAQKVFTGRVNLKLK